jgi:hypothetical protein
LANQDRQHDALPEQTIKLSGLSTDDHEGHIQKRMATGELHQNVAFHPKTPPISSLTGDGKSNARGQDISTLQVQDAARPYLTYSPPFRPRYLASLAKLAKEEACGGQEVGESLLNSEAHDAQVGAESAEGRAKDTLVSLGASLTPPERLYPVFHH